ncbi:unnamed protein product [Sphagnum balticum]
MCNDKGMAALEFRQLANLLGVYWRKSGGDSPILVIVDSSNRYAGECPPDFHYWRKSDWRKSYWRTSGYSSTEEEREYIGDG